MNLFDINLIKTNITVTSKSELLDMMINDLYENGIIQNKEAFTSVIWERENIHSTGIGHTIAIPHARVEDVTELKIVVYTLLNDLEYDSIDDQPVKIIFMVAVPINAHKEYILALSHLSKLMHQKDNRDRLINSSDKTQIFDFLNGIKIM